MESRLWSSQGWNFPRCTTTTENGREAASLSPLGMWLPLLTSQSSGSKGENGGGERTKKNERGGTQNGLLITRVLRKEGVSHYCAGKYQKSILSIGVVHVKVSLGKRTKKYKVLIIVHCGEG